MVYAMTLDSAYSLGTPHKDDSYPLKIMFKFDLSFKVDTLGTTRQSHESLYIDTAYSMYIHTYIYLSMSVCMYT